MPTKAQLIAEKADLDKRLNVLVELLLALPITVNLQEEQRMRSQAYFMGEYRDILGERINAMVL